MELEEKLQCFTTAMAMSGICMSNEIAEVILLTHESIIKKKNKFSIMDSVKIKHTVREKYRLKDKNDIKTAEILDMIKEKIEQIIA
jgi:hypothetical protein